MRSIAIPPFTGGAIVAASWPWPTARPDTNGSQFFIMHGNSRLQPNYVIFGNVVEGLPVVDALATVTTARSSSGEMSRPTRPLVIRKVEVLP